MALIGKPITPMQLATSVRSSGSLELSSILEIATPPTPMVISSVAAVPPATEAGCVGQVIVPGTTLKSQRRIAPSITNI